MIRPPSGPEAAVGKVTQPYGEDPSVIPLLVPLPTNHRARTRIQVPRGPASSQAGESNDRSKPVGSEVEMS